MQIRIESPEEIHTAAKRILELFSKQKVFAFYGEMGSGKTTLIKAICEQLGVQGQTASPTFSIINEYDASNNSKIYHFDLYRVKNKTELLQLGCEEYFYSGNYCFIEWPELAIDLLPKESILLKIIVEGDARVIHI